MHSTPLSRKLDGNLEHCVVTTSHYVVTTSHYVVANSDNMKIEVRVSCIPIKKCSIRNYTKPPVYTIPMFMKIYVTFIFPFSLVASWLLSGIKTTL